MRRFKLFRKVDETGISGTGYIAEGVQFTSGKCALSWMTRHASIGIYDDIETLEAIHGHGGKTVVEWDDAHRSTLPSLDPVEECPACGCQVGGECPFRCKP